MLCQSLNSSVGSGVGAWVADYFGMDVTLVRLIVAIITVVTGGVGALAYLAGLRAGGDHRSRHATGLAPSLAAPAHRWKQIASFKFPV
jgi:phage shock protein PspC (stress-responsive transcriptional regulator)